MKRGTKRVIALMALGVPVILLVCWYVLGGKVSWFPFRERYTVEEAREGVLRDDLAILRAEIQQYTLDKQRRPEALQDLVESGYLKRLPTDPMTGRVDTWVVDWSTDPKKPGVRDVHSGSGSKGRDGRAYREW